MRRILSVDGVHHLVAHNDNGRYRWCFINCFGAFPANCFWFSPAERDEAFAIDRSVLREDDRCVDDDLARDSVTCLQCLMMEEEYW
jgi:hypothetical protein